MKKRYSLTIYNLLGLSAAGCCIYYLLLRDSALPFSLHSILNHIHSVVNHWPVLIIGLLPVYIALMIFGLAAIGLYLGSLLERCVSRFFQNRNKTL